MGGSLSEGRADCVSVGANSFIPFLAGPDAPTPARGQGLQPYGALYCFEWRSEGVQGGERKAPCWHQ